MPTSIICFLPLQIVTNSSDPDVGPETDDILQKRKDIKSNNNNKNNKTSMQRAIVFTFFFFLFFSMRLSILF